MKRFFFTAIALAAVAVSCTKSGLLETPKTYEAPITFEPYTGKTLATKADVAQIEDIESVGFKVVGFLEDDSNAINPEQWNIINHTVTKPANSDWTYGTPAYWPDGQDLTFVAFGNNASANITYPTTEGTGNSAKAYYTKLTYDVPTTASAQEDLLLSPVMQNNNSETDVVTVELYHALSRVGFTLKTENSSSSPADVTITDIRLNGKFITNATFDLSKITKPSNSGKTLSYYETIGTDVTEDMLNFTTNTKEVVSYKLFSAADHFFSTSGLTPDATPAVDGSSYTYRLYNIYHSHTSDGNGGSTAASTTNKDDRFMMIMPGQVGNVNETTKPNISVTYTLTDGETRTVPVDLVKDDENWTFEPGKAYEFVFTVSTVAVGFDVEVNIWNPTNNDTSNPQTTPETEIYPLY